MTLPPSIRIFFAIDLPPAVKDKMNEFMRSLKKQIRSKAIRWSKPDNLHITLQFLDQAERSDLPELIGQVRLALGQGLPPFMIALGNPHCFPSVYHPRVIVFDVTPQEPLADLSARIGKGIRQAGYQTEDRPFRAHLTIGRIKNAQTVDMSFINTITMPPIEPIRVEEIVLFRSEPMPDASQYTKLDVIRL